MNDYNEINAFAVHLTGYFTYVTATNIYGVRPVISIRGDITVTGDGNVLTHLSFIVLNKKYLIKFDKFYH